MIPSPLSPPRPAGTYGPGTLSLLLAPSITAFFPDITLAGQRVDHLGQLSGERETSEVAVEYLGSDSSRYRDG